MAGRAGLCAALKCVVFAFASLPREGSSQGLQSHLGEVIMSMNDLISDALTRIRNGQTARHESVNVRMNKPVEAILSILKEEGFIASVTPYKEGAANMAKVELKYSNGRAVITGIERVSRPGLRTYRKIAAIRPTLNNLGISIVSTSKGVMSDKNARVENTGGEILCRVW